MKTENQFTSFISLSALVALGLLSSLVMGCGKDRTLDNYKNQKVLEDLGRLQGVSGTYQGTVYSRTDSRPMGTLKVTLTPDTRTSTNATASDRRAVLSAEIQYTDTESSKSIASSTGYYDSSTESFQIEIPFVTPGNVASAILNLSGQLTPTSMTGKIEALSYADSGGTFTLTREGNFSRIAATEGPGSRARHMLGSTYAGTDPEGQLEQEIQMTLTPEHMNTDLEFLTAFRPVRLVSVGLSFFNDQFRVTIPRAEWDLRARTLKGETIESGVKVSLSCNELARAGWSCLWSASTRSFRFDVIPMSPQGEATR